jgi:hypothetical protein
MMAIGLVLLFVWLFGLAVMAVEHWMIRRFLKTGR